MGGAVTGVGEEVHTHGAVTGGLVVGGLVGSVVGEEVRADLFFLAFLTVFFLVDPLLDVLRKMRDFWFLFFSDLSAREARLFKLSPLETSAS